MGFAVTRISKLYARVLANPRASLSFRDFERLLKAFGFLWVRTAGSHRQYVRPGVAEVLTVLPEGKDAKRYQIARLLAIVDEYDLSIGDE